MRLVLAACSLALLVAFYQETGGSFGGGDFGGGSDYSGGSSDYSGGGGSDYSSSSSSFDFGSSGGGGGGGGAWIGLMIMVLIVSVAVIHKIAETHARNRRLFGRPGVPRRDWNRKDVTVIMLAIDWRARAKVQNVLERIARSGDMSSRKGLCRALHETAVALLRAEVSWLYAAAQNAQPMPSSSAEEMFRRAAADARARYNTEIVRSDEVGVATQAAPEMRARSEEGEGVVVITLCVAARRELIDLPQTRDAGQLRRALLDLGSLSLDDLVALEVIWSPASENDRMSTAELVVKYPELSKIDEKSLAGRVFCSYCQGPYPAELLKCPHCGGVAEK